MIWFMHNCNIFYSSTSLFHKAGLKTITVLYSPFLFDIIAIDQEKCHTNVYLPFNINQLVGQGVGNKCRQDICKV